MQNTKFESDYCLVNYLDKENIVLIQWKKFCELANYRNPTTFALKLLENNKDSNLLIDARNGFEDNKDDIKWAFSYLLPAMSKTYCKKVVFVMTKVNKIEEEMNLWEKEFSKYFHVSKVDSFENGINNLK